MSCYNAGANRMSAKYNPSKNTKEKFGGLIESYAYFDKSCTIEYVGAGCGHLGLLIALRLWHRERSTTRAMRS